LGTLQPLQLGDCFNLQPLSLLEQHLLLPLGLQLRLLAAICSTLALQAPFLARQNQLDLHNLLYVTNLVASWFRVSLSSFLSTDSLLIIFGMRVDDVVVCNVGLCSLLKLYGERICSYDDAFVTVHLTWVHSLLLLLELLGQPQQARLQEISAFQAFKLHSKVLITLYSFGDIGKLVAFVSSLGHKHCLLCTHTRELSAPSKGNSVTISVISALCMCDNP